MSLLLSRGGLLLFVS